jgi:cytochrome c556
MPLQHNPKQTGQSMNTASRIFIRTIPVLGFTALVACGGPAYDPSSPEGQAYETRFSIMEDAGTRMELINNMAREQIPLDEAAFETAVVELAALTARMPEGFDEAWVVPGSRADPIIWDNKADFDTRMDAAIEATAMLAQVVQNQGFAAAQQLVVTMPTTSSNCSGCHNTYRLPDED